jgi:TolB-like protein/tetratricopeptide (TPR) repeat protein
LLYLFDDFVLDADLRELHHGSKRVSLAPQVFDLLEYLICNRERVVTKDNLFASIWDGRVVSDSALNTRINAARRAIDDTGVEQRLIRTLPRKGLRFIGEVREEQKPPRLRGPEGAMAAERQGPALIHPDRPSIAVLPFVNMSGDPEQDFFADGMAEEIITALSHCSRVFVAARNSSFAYKGKSVDVRQVGRELGVRYVLEGSIRRGGDRLRFTGQLIDAASGGHIWADRFEGEVGNVLDLQDSLTESVVAAIEPKLQQAEIERLKHRPASDLDPYDLLLRAQQCEYQFCMDGHTSALRHLEQALGLDPSYAPAMALAALCYAQRRDQGWMTNLEGEARDGLRFASRAIELGKDDANVFWMAGYAVYRLQMNASLARELVRHSLELNPNSAIASAIAGAIEYTTGHTRGGLELLFRASRLSPRDPRGWLITSHLAWAHLIEGKLDHAISAAERVVSQSPRSAYALRFLAAGLAQRGRLIDAANAVRRVLSVEPQLTLTKLRARLTFVDDKTWRKYSAALRLAGLPE